MPACGLADMMEGTRKKAEFATGLPCRYQAAQAFCSMSVNKRFVNDKPTTVTSVAVDINIPERDPQH